MGLNIYSKAKYTTFTLENSSGDSYPKNLVDIDEY